MKNKSNREKELEKKLATVEKKLINSKDKNKQLSKENKGLKKNLLREDKSIEEVLNIIATMNL